MLKKGVKAQQTEYSKESIQKHFNLSTENLSKFMYIVERFEVRPIKINGLLKLKYSYEDITTIYKISEKISEGIPINESNRSSPYRIHDIIERFDMPLEYDTLEQKLSNLLNLNQRVSLTNFLTYSNSSELRDEMDFDNTFEKYKENLMNNNSIDSFNIQYL